MMEQSLAELVRAYSEKYRNPKLEPFVVHELHTMTSWYGTAEARTPGCYVCYSENGDPLYVGAASWRSYMGARLAAHHHRKPRSPWRERAVSVQFVSVPEAFEALSLEEFLIGKLQPPGNIRGIIQTPASN